MNYSAPPTAAPATALEQSPSGFDLKNPYPFARGGRVRVVRGPLAGLTGVLVDQDVSSRWLVQTDHSEGVFVRAESDAIELL